MRTVAAIALAATLAHACISQQPAAPAEKPFVVEAGETKLMDLVDRCANHLQWNVLVSEQEMGGQVLTVRLQQRIEVDHAGCEDLLTTMLFRSGFALTVLDQQKRIYEVINMVGPRNREITLRAVARTTEEILARPGLRVPVTTVVQLKHINAVIATNALRPFFASSGGPTSALTIGNIGNNTSLLLSGMQDQVAAAIGLLATADVPERPELDWEKGGKKLWDRLEAIERRLDAIEKKAPAPESR